MHDNGHVAYCEIQLSAETNVLQLNLLHNVVEGLV